MTSESGAPSASRRVFLAGTGAAAGAASVAALLGGPLAEAARAAEPGSSLPNYAPVPKSALGPRSTPTAISSARSRVTCTG